MDSLALCCGRRCSVHEVAVQPSLENGMLFAYTGQSDQKMSITPCLSGKLLFIFYSCVLYLSLSGTLLACTASIDTLLLLSLYTDDYFWKGNPFAVPLSTPLLCVCIFHCKPHGEAKSVIMKASPAVIKFVPYFNCLEYSVSLK